LFYKERILGNGLSWTAVTYYPSPITRFHCFFFFNMR